MTPRVTKPGSCFKSCFRYYLFDKEATTQERIGWTMALNVVDRGVETWKMMAYTAMSAKDLKQSSGQKMTGRKLTKPVFVYSLSWHPDQDPDHAQMESLALESLTRLGLTEHEVQIVSHVDTAHPHLHVIVNRVHPVTGLAADTGQAVALLQELASDYERETGIYCRQREVNRQRRERGGHARYGDLEIQAAWDHSDCGKSFSAALEAKGYLLARGRKRVVVVDPHGKAHNPLRHLNGVKSAMLRERLRNLNVEQLPSSHEVQALVKMQGKDEYHRAWNQRQVLSQGNKESELPARQVDQARRFEQVLGL